MEQYHIPEQIPKAITRILWGPIIFTQACLYVCCGFEKKSPWQMGVVNLLALKIHIQIQDIDSASMK